MPNRPVRCEVLFRQPEESHRRIHPPAILGMGGPRMLFLQVHKAAGRLNQPFEIIPVLRFGPQPEVFEHVMCFVVALFIPTPKKTEITRMLRDLVRRLIGGGTAQLLDQPGNSLAFVHGALSFVSAVMTGNRTRILFPGRALRQSAAERG